jgi:hypothetical protein
MIKIPTYEEALERHETPLDVFISRWEPVGRGHDRKNFRNDLKDLIDYIVKSAQDEPATNAQ